MTYPDESTKFKIVTRSGRLLDVKNPDPADINIEDIAHGLSRQLRYGGAFGDYSVAQHSVAVAACVYDAWPANTPGLWNAMRVAMLHDASETYIRDIPTPAKRLLPDYVFMEGLLMEAIFQAFKLEADTQAIVYKADQSVGGAEAIHLIKGIDLGGMFQEVQLRTRANIIEYPMTMDAAKELFLRLWIGLEEFPTDEGVKNFWPWS